MSWCKYVIVGGIAYIGGLLTVPVINMIITATATNDVVCNTGTRGDEKFHELYDPTIANNVPKLLRGT